MPHTTDDFADLDVVDCHLADLALSGVPNLLCSPLLSRDDLPEQLRRQIILLSLLGLHERLGKQLPGRGGNLLGITQANGSAHLQTVLHLRGDRHSSLSR